MNFRLSLSWVHLQFYFIFFLTKNTFSFSIKLKQLLKTLWDRQTHTHTQWGWARARPKQEARNSSSWWGWHLPTPKLHISRRLDERRARTHSQVLTHGWGHHGLHLSCRTRCPSPWTTVYVPCIWVVCWCPTVTMAVEITEAPSPWTPICLCWISCSQLRTEVSTFSCIPCRHFVTHQI